MLSEPTKCFGRDISVYNTNGGTFDEIELSLKQLRNKFVINAHIGDSEFHITSFIHDEQIGTRGLSGNGNGISDIDSYCSAALLKLACMTVISEG